MVGFQFSFVPLLRPALATLIGPLYLAILRRRTLQQSVNVGFGSRKGNE